jgi:hypothetical protein
MEGKIENLVNFLKTHPLVFKNILILVFKFFIIIIHSASLKIIYLLVTLIIIIFLMMAPRKNFLAGFSISYNQLTINQMCSRPSCKLF